MAALIPEIRAAEWIFAQYEREVTCERIRDKVAASKRKGLWMGGRVTVRITVALDTFVIALNKGALRSALLPGASASSQQAEDDPIELRIEARMQRRGRSVRLVVTPHEASATNVQEDQTLIEVLAQGQRWFEQLLRGEVASLRAIAQSAGKSERHVSQVIRAAFLAPELVEAALQGRRPARLTLRGVMKELPWDWNEQRRFGLAPGINDSLSVRD